MPCCCSNPYVIGCANVCSNLTINYTAPANGDYSIIANYYGGIIEVVSSIAAGAPLVFDLSELNANYRYQFAVLHNGVALSFVDADSNIFNCFDVSLQPYGAAATTAVLTLE